MKLKVLKRFRGKEEEGKTLSSGDVITTTDLVRVNVLVSRGFCEIISIEDISENKVEVNGEFFSVEEVKKAMVTIGVTIAANAGIKGVSNAIEKLSDEQKVALIQAIKD